jgi:hypothetical protein
MASTTSYPVPDDSLALLWEGENPELHTALLEALESAGIPFADRALGDQGTTPVDPLPIDWRPRFGFEVSVASSQLTAAREILEKLLDRDPVDMELPADESAVAVNVGRGASSEAGQKPTLEIWSSPESRMSQFLEDALRENSIPLEVRTSSKGTTIFVPPSAEARAREIVREVTQSTPPQ